MSQPKISVVIPVYNAAAYFRRTLERVVRQSLPAHEIIVINDGSTDGTQAILDDYRGRIITRTIPNSGCAAARQAGVALSTGEWLAFLDADDLWFRKRLRVMSEVMERFPEIDFFCSNYIVYSDRRGRLVKHYDDLPNRRCFNFDTPLKDNPFRLLLANNFAGTPSTVIIRKSLYVELGGFDPDCRLVEDLDFFLHVATRTNFVLVEEPLFYKHTHRESMSFDKIKLYEGHKKILLHSRQRDAEYIQRYGFEKDWALGLADVNKMLGNLYFEAWQRKKARSHFMEALRVAPYPGNALEVAWSMMKKGARFLSRGYLSKKNLYKTFKASEMEQGNPTRPGVTGSV